jgi:hypothetical protein
VAHSTSAIIVAAFVVGAVLLDVALRLIRGRARPRTALAHCWHDGIVAPVAAAVALAYVLGAGVVAHLWLQARVLGRPVSYRFLDPHWIDRAALDGYYGAPFLVLSLIALALVLTRRTLRHDRAMPALAALALGCVAVSQLWRLEVRSSTAASSIPSVSALPC